MSKPATANDFLAKMGMLTDGEPVVVGPPKAVATQEPVRAAHKSAPVALVKPRAAKAAAETEPKAVKVPPSRAKLKHIGAYLNRDDCEKIALLRARLELDNSELIALAITNLYKTESAKRKFGDA